MFPIYVDFDDVLSDTTTAFLKILKSEYGKSVNFEDIFTFDLKASFNLSDLEYEHFFHRVHQADEIMAFTPMEGAIRTLEEWISLAIKSRSSPADSPAHMKPHWIGSLNTTCLTIPL